MDAVGRNVLGVSDGNRDHAPSRADAQPAEKGWQDEYAGRVRSHRVSSLTGGGGVSVNVLRVMARRSLPRGVSRAA